MTNNNFFENKLLRPLKFLMFIGLVAIILFGIVQINKKLQYSITDIFENIEQKGIEFEYTKLLKSKNFNNNENWNWFNQYKTNKDSLLSPPHILLGAHDNNAGTNFASVFSLEQKLNTNFPIIQLYVPWGSRNEQKFPVHGVKTIINKGALPLITWEPWLSEFEQRKYPQLRPSKDRDKGGLADISKRLYDEYIIEWAKDIKKIKMPIFIRWGHEMNDAYRYPWGPQNNKPYEYIKAWRHIHETFKELGVENVIWVWCPQISYLDYDKYYPGHEYVDYIGMNLLNYGEAVSWGGWMSFSKLFDKHYNHFKYFNKPIMIAEFSTLEYGGDRCKWYAEALDNFPKRYPAVKSVLFFHVNNDNTTSLKSLDWQFSDDSVCTSVIADKIEKWTK